jgi:hypothetical protein
MEGSFGGGNKNSSSRHEKSNLLQVAEKGLCLHAGRQMQVELCEIPPAGVSASLSPAVQAGNPEEWCRGE